LTKNANKHSDDFVQGMDLVEEVNNDLQTSRNIADETRRRFSDIKENITKCSMKVLIAG